jgi:integrase
MASRSAIQIFVAVALIGKLLYGSGMRLLEGLRLRVKDVVFDRHQILVRDGKDLHPRPGSPRKFVIVSAG